MKKFLAIILTLVLVGSGTLSPVYSQVSSSISSYSEGINTKATGFSKYIELSEQLTGYMLATEDGLMFVGNSDFKIHTDYPVKDYLATKDLDGDGIKEMLVYLDVPNEQDSVALISSKNSEVLFSKNFMHINTDSNGKAFNENSLVLQMLYANELIYLISDYHLMAFDLSGKQIFDVTDENNIWKMISVNQCIVYTTQTGMVKAIDGQSGKRLWQNQVAYTISVPTYEEGKNADVQLNAWDICKVNDMLLVTTEDGQLVSLNAENGEIIQSVALDAITKDQLVRLFNNQQGYINNSGVTVYQTGLTSPNFMGYTLEPLNNEKIMISAYLGGNHYDVGNTDTTHRDVSPVIMIYDINTQTVTTRINIEQYNLYCSNAVVSSYNGQEALILASYSQKGVLKINAYDLNSGQLLAQENIKIPTIKEKDEKIGIVKMQDRYFIQSVDNISFYLLNDLKTVEYLGNISLATKITDTDDGTLIGYSQSGKMDTIQKIGAGDRNNLIYSVSLPEEYQQNSNGFENCYYNESSHELLTLVQVQNANHQVEASAIIIIDTDTGAVSVNQKVVLDKGIDDKGKAYTTYVIGENIRYLADLNHDGHLEILLDQYVIDGKSMTLKSIYSPTISETGLNLEVGDINGDGISDIINLSETEAILYYSKVSNYEISYAKTDIKYAYGKDLQNHILAILAPDFNHDGIKDIIINERNANGLQIYRVLDSKTLTKRFDLMAEGVFDWGESFEFLETDINGDGYDEIIYNNPYSECELLSGQTGETLFKYNHYPVYGSHNYASPSPLENIVPIRIEEKSQSLVQINDLDHDGKQDLVYLSRNYLPSSYNEYVVLNFVSSNDFSLIREEELGNSDLYNFEIVPIQNANKLIYEDDGLAQIFDYEKMLPVAGFNLNITFAKAIDEHTTLISDINNNLYEINDAPDFTLENTYEGERINGKVTFNWLSEKNGKMVISDQGEKVITTNSSSSTLQLLEGEHTIKFSYDDGHGKTTHQSIQVTVHKSHTLRYLMIVLLFMSIGTFAGLILYPKYQLKKKAGVKHG